MGKITAALTNFNAGELSPDFAGRVDNEKYPVGCALMQNFIPMVQGPVVRRPGSVCVEPVKSSATKGFVRRFVFSQGQAYVLEFGNHYVRFYTNHGQVNISTPAAWSSTATYAQGALVSYNGYNWYCYIPQSTVNIAPSTTTPGSNYWWQLTGTIYEIPSPWSSSTLFNSDGSVALQFEQSADVLYICSGQNGVGTTLPVTLTRYGATNWQFAWYTSPDGPFLPQNTNSSPAIWISSISGGAYTQTQYNVYSTAPLFSPSDAGGFTTLLMPATPGRLLRLGPMAFNLPVWTPGVAIEAQSYVRYDGNTYQALNSATSGSSPPVHTQGVELDGTGGVRWLYTDSGYGILQITSYVSSTHVVATASPYAGEGNGVGSQYYNPPPPMTSAQATNITAITQASEAEVSTTTAAPNVGDLVYLTGVGGMTQISENMYTGLGYSAPQTTLNVNSTGFSAYTSGGQMILGATLNYQLGAWASPSAQTPGSYPVCACFWEDRLFFAGGINWWGSVPGAYTSMAEDIYGVVTADSAVSGILAAQDVDQIQWMAPAMFLLIGTTGGEFAMTSLNSGSPLGPSNIDVERQTKMRSRAIKPEIVGNTNLYVQLGGKKLLAQDYTFYLSRYDSTNQNRLANHIAGYTAADGIVDIAWHAEPYECLWCITAQGTLIGYTFDRQDNVTGWHEHVMGPSLAGPAAVESICVIPAPDGTRDELWMIVNRTINGAVQRTVEYLSKDWVTGDAVEAMDYLDCSATYSGAATTTITGLSYLNGETVSVFSQGQYAGTFTVSGGAITVPSTTYAVVGLAYTSKLVTQRIEGGADFGSAQGKLKRLTHCNFRVQNAMLGQYGLNGVTVNGNTVVPMQSGAPTSLTTPYTGDLYLPFPGATERNGQIVVQESYPFQFELVAMFPVITVSEPSSP